LLCSYDSVGLRLSLATAALAPVLSQLLASRLSAANAPNNPVTSVPQDEMAPGLLSAFFGLDNGLPSVANRLCLGACGDNGMPVVLSHTVDSDTLQPEDVQVTSLTGAISTPDCVTLTPAEDSGELRRVLC